MPAEIAQTRDEVTRQDRVGCIANRLSRRDLVLNLGRWTASAAGLAMLGGCQFMKPAATTPAGARRIGFLYSGDRGGNQPGFDAFVDRLRQLGWVEDENLSIE